MQQSGGPMGGGQRSSLIGCFFGFMVIVILAIVIVLVFRAVRSNNTDTTTSAPIGANVTLTASGPSPQAVTISKGQAVKWTNNDTVQHRLVFLTSTGLPETRGTTVDPGKSSTRTFNDTGTTSYQDQFRSTNVQATITVN